jgi:5'-nucleotidase
MKNPKRILLSNDDGLLANGLQTLFKALVEEGHDVTAVAPESEQSTSGHSLTLHKPLRLYRIEDHQYAVSGTPADCVYLGLAEVMKDNPPDIVLSGINRGANLANDVYYSGTVAAAREAYLAGFSAIAVSLAIAWKETKTPVEAYKHNYDAASDLVLDLLDTMVPQAQQKRFLWNVNVPDLRKREIKGLKFCRMGERHYSNILAKRKDPKNRPYYWIAGDLTGHNKSKDTDCTAVENGYVSISPLQVDCSNPQELENLKKLK